MRVWDCDPRLLCTKHLRAQHAEIHFAVRVIQNDWRTKWKDVERFRSHRDGIEWLTVVHDITVKELEYRGKFANHKTPLDRPSFLFLFRPLIQEWILGGLQGDEYLKAFDFLGYPRTQLNQGTPWERDNVSFEWYQAHHNDWTRALAEAEGKRNDRL